MLAFGDFIEKETRVELENGSFYLYFSGTFKKLDNSIFDSRK